MDSLHVKYRPTKFEDVLGQDVIVRSLKKVIKDARNHVFCFTGPSGTGKTTLARIVAAACVGLDQTVVNVEEVDGASKSGADDMRALITKSLYRAVGGSPTKFIIIDEAHRLSAAAWTVLLKPIEEPPPHVYWALCTTEPAKIPKAVATRCLKYDLKPVKEEQILELLVSVVDAENLEISDELLEIIAEASLGSPRQALVNLESCLSCRNVADARELLHAAGNSKEAVDLARWLLAGKGLNWGSAVRLIKAMEGQEAEGVRIVLLNYFAAVLVSTTSEGKAKGILRLMACFDKPYYTPEKLAPLFNSIGLAIGMDQ